MELHLKLNAYVQKFNGEHEEWYRNAIPNENAAKWMEQNIPFFECSDSSVEETYYFRFWTFRKHIRETEDGTVITEFLPDVRWAGPHNTISCPLGHHVLEGRWLRDSSILESDIRFFLKDENTDHAMKYSSSFLWSVYLYILYSGRLEFGREILPQMISQYEAWEVTHLTEYGLFWSNDNRDGMEYSISGKGLRPTLNTYLYGAALGIAELCKMAGDPRESLFREKAISLRRNIHTYLFDEKAKFYKTVPMDAMDTHPDFRRELEGRDVREEVGFIPFTVPTLCDEEDEACFRLLMDPDVFLAPFGITTADMSHPFFMQNKVHHECLWDGPVWPYSTSATLTGIYTLLSEKGSAYIGAKDYMQLLGQYAASQKLYDGRKVINWIDENQDPFTGQWIARDLLYLDHAYRSPKERGADYNHSTFCDLVLSGACGIKADTDLKSGGRTLHVKPLAEGTWKYFAVQNLQFGGSLYDVYYDADLSRYGYETPLTLVRDGQVVATGKTELSYTF